MKIGIDISQDEKKYYLEKTEQFGWGIKTVKINSDRAKLVKKYLKGNRILDIGCGSGIWVDYFARQGYEATGIDFVQEFISRAKKKYQGNFVTGGAEKLPFPAGSFDTVLMFSVLEHIDNQKKVLREAKRVGERLILIVPQKTPNILIKRGLVFKHRLDRSHKRVYTKNGIKKLLNIAAFKVKNIIKIERLPAISIFPELFIAPKLIRRLITRLFFWLFKEKNYYLELMVIADKQ